MRGDVEEGASGLHDLDRILLTTALEKAKDGWIRRLRGRWGEAAEEKLALLKSDQAKQRDLLSLVGPVMRREKGAFDRAVADILSSVRRQEYSISDLYLELSTLFDAQAEALERFDEVGDEDRQRLRDWLLSRVRAVFLRVLDETSAVYETVVESGGRAFCQVDAKGRITYANDRMHKLLGVERALGEEVGRFFGEEAEYVSAAVGGKHGARPNIRRLTVHRDDGSRVPVNAEVAPVDIEDGRKGGYASLTDISQLIEAENKIFERLPVGMLRVDRHLNITWANRQALRIAGAESFDAVTLHELLADEENRETVRESFARRLEGDSEEYEVEIKRLDSSHRRTVAIAAAPEMDSQGEVIGALTILRDVELERTRQKIHTLIESERSPERLFEKVAKELSRTLDLDFVSATLYSSDSRHARVIAFVSLGKRLEFRTRWFPISESLLEWLSQPDVQGGDFQRFVQRQEMEKLREDPTMKEFKKTVKSFISYPMKEKGRLVANVLLSSGQANAFQGHEEMIAKLPFDRALQMVFHDLAIAERNFEVETIRQVVEADDLRGVAERLVQALASYHDWQNVSIFRVSLARNEFQLLAQASSKEAGWLLDPKYKQDLDTGVLSHVYRKEISVKIDNVETDKEFKDIFVRQSPRTVSELCIPITLGAEIRWILNVEDDRLNAFSLDEVRELERFLREVTLNILNTAFGRLLFDEIKKGASDGIIYTDEGGQIDYLNPAAEELLGDVTSRPFEEMFKDREIGAAVVAAAESKGRVTLLNKRNKQEPVEVEVMLDSVKLAEEFGQKVFLIHDLSLAQRLEELEGLEQMFHEIATQTSTPLVLAVGWLQELKARSKSNDVADTLEKAIRQLSRVELTYERLALFDPDKGDLPYSPLRADVGWLVDSVLRELPEIEGKKVQVELEDKQSTLSADLFQMNFVLQSVLFHFIRFCPLDEKVRLTSETVGRDLELRIEGSLPASYSGGGGAGEASADAEAAARTRAALALGEPVIQRFMEQHGGSYRRTHGPGSAAQIVLKLPLVG